MSEKITLNLFLMGIVASVLSMFLTGMVMYQLYHQQVLSDLQLQGEMIATVYLQEGGQEALEIYQDTALRITLMDQGGIVLYENTADSLSMDNQLERQEVQQALEQGSGTATRMSESLGTLSDYYAIVLEDGAVLRVSVEDSGLFDALRQCIIMLFPLVLLLALLAVGIAWLLTRRLLRPLSSLPADLENPQLAEDSTRVYPELAPFIRELQAQRRDRENMRQEFTANVTHELKTPLTSISGYAEMISTGLAKTDDIPRFAEKIRIEALRMQSLVNDIIELSELDRNESTQPPEEVELLSVAQECWDQLSVSAQQKGVHIRVKGDAFTVLGDEKRLWELIYNLVDNAIRYNRRGGWVEITVNPRERLLTVADYGIGIPEEHQSRVFERFYRVDKSHSRATGGTGLGLSIVKHVAEQQGARITLKSTVNVGTEIRIHFPNP